MDRLAPSVIPVISGMDGSVMSRLPGCRMQQLRASVSSLRTVGDFGEVEIMLCH